MRQKTIIAPSLLAADFARFGEEVAAVEKAGADWIHIDVMDNHYVPNLTFGPEVCCALKRYGITLPMDVHLMIEPVDDLIPAFAEAGAQTITFHPEASKHPHRTLTLIREAGCSPGIVLNPATPITYLSSVLSEIDMVLLMSVNPGFGGQSFIASTYAKIKQVRELIDAQDRPIRLAVDGGVTAENIGRIAAAGADVFVAGSAVFRAKDYRSAVEQLRAAAV